MKTRRIFRRDIVGPVYNRPRLHDAFAQAEKRDPIFRLLRTKLGVNFKGKSVLEIGAGTGVNVSFLNKAGAKTITALEPHSSAARYGKKLGRKGLRVGYIKDFPRSEKNGNLPTVVAEKRGLFGKKLAIVPQHDIVFSMFSFGPIVFSYQDQLVSSGAFKTLEERRNFARRTVLDEMLRNVKPGGKLVIGDFLPSDASKNPKISPRFATYIDETKNAINELEKQGYGVKVLHDVAPPFRAEGRRARLVLKALRRMPNFYPSALKELEDTKKLDTKYKVDLFVITKPVSMRRSTPKVGTVEAKVSIGDNI